MQIKWSEVLAEAQQEAPGVDFTPKQVTHILDGLLAILTREDFTTTQQDQAAVVARTFLMKAIHCRLIAME